jgi:hypothetical protein
MERANIEEHGGAVVRRDEEREDQAGQEPGEIDGVGQNADAQVGNGENDDQADKEQPLEGCGSDVESQVAAHEEQPSGQLNERIHWGDGQLAGAAFATQPEPAKDRHIIVRLDGRFATWAAGARRNDRQPLRNARNAHIQEAANHNAKKEKEEKHHRMTLT